MARRFIKIVSTLIIVIGLLVSGWQLGLYYNEYCVADIHSVNIGRYYYHKIIILDGIVYKNCQFEDVVFVYEGDGPIYMIHCEILGSNSIHTTKAILALLSPFEEIPPTPDTRPIPSQEQLTPPFKEL